MVEWQQAKQHTDKLGYKCHAANEGTQNCGTCKQNDEGGIMRTNQGQTEVYASCGNKPSITKSTMQSIMALW